MTGSASGTENESVKWRHRVPDQKDILRTLKTELSVQGHLCGWILAPLLYIILTFSNDWWIKGTGNDQ